MTVTVDEITRSGHWPASLPDSRWLRRQVDQLVGTVPDELAAPARVLLEEVALACSHALEPGAGLSPRSCARVRAAGEDWAAAGIPLDAIVTEFGELTTRLADLLVVRQGVAAPLVRNVMTAGNKVMREFLVGASRWRLRARAERRLRAAGDLVADLIVGGDLAPEGESQLASAYLVVVVNRQEHALVPQLGRIVRECGGDGTLIGAAAEFVALIPDRGSRHARRVVEALAQRLDGQARVGVARCERAAIPDGHREAADIVRLVVAAEREPGVYRLEDCLVEYAVCRNKTVAENLASIVAPLTDHPVLWETLEVLIRADFNRNDAAKRMFVHRSTLDYRLRRIAEMTGHDPTSSRGAQEFCAAMTVHALGALGRGPVGRPGGALLAC